MVSYKLEGQLEFGSEFLVRFDIINAYTEYLGPEVANLLILVP